MSRLVAYCRTLPAATEDIKWGEHVCFSVGGKLFAIFSEDLAAFTVKVDPADFAVLTSVEGIEPAAYLARAGWVTASPGAGVGHALARRLLSDSWRIVSKGLSAKTRLGLGLSGADSAPRRPRRPSAKRIG